MSRDRIHRDLVVLAADKDAEMALHAILSRHEALGIRSISVDCFVHPEHDPGCLLRAHEFLRAFLKTHERALVVCDREGSGAERSSRADLEAQIEDRLARNGWAERAAAVVIDPELEIWIWSDSPEVDQELGWAGRIPKLRDCLYEEGLLMPSADKPPRPKEAVERALYLARKPRSSSTYRQLARRVSLQRCTDPAFEKLRRTLRGWFAAN